MLDFDLAELCGVETRALVQAVKRNMKRFPEDFMFQLTKRELENWRSQFVISNSGVKMGSRRAPFAFSEQGVAMLSSVLKSDRAVEVNVQIMRTFVQLRELMLTHRDLARKLAELEMKYDGQFTVVFDASGIETEQRAGDPRVADVMFRPFDEPTQLVRVPRRQTFDEEHAFEL